MRPSFFPLTGSAVVIGIRLWTTVKELTWLEAYAMIMSSVVFAYKKRKKFLPFFSNLWSSLNDLKSLVVDNSNHVSPNTKVDTKNKRKLSQDMHKEAKKMAHSSEANSSSLKKRQGIKNMKNSAQNAFLGATTSTDHKIKSSSVTSTHHVDESAQTPCTGCDNYIKFDSSLSDMPTMPGCFHKYCKPCFGVYFSDIIIQADVAMWFCPECGDSSISDYQTYYKEFAVILTRFMSTDIAEIAREKLDQWFKYQESVNSGPYQSVTLCECEMCLKMIRESELIRMPSCEHRFCKACTRDYFNIEIDERELVECYCPFCLKNQDMISKEYFIELGQLLKPLLHVTVLQKFERKLRELSYTYMCIKCHSPVNACSKVVKCQNCLTEACRDCRLLWEPEHSRMSCEQYELWIHGLTFSTHRMSRQPIDCVSCGERFLFVRDGTLVFTCPKCQAQMCHSCKSPFYLGVACPKGKEKCCFLFFHAHHPENCLFYLQHKEVKQLHMLLEKKNLHPKQISADSSSCQVEVKRIVREQIVYVPCGQVLCNLGLCKNHALDFLSTIAVQNSVGTMELFDKSDEAIFNKRSWKEMCQRQFYHVTNDIEENKSQSQVPHSFWQHTATKSPNIPSCSGESQFQGARSSWQHKDTDAKSSTTSSRSDKSQFQGVHASWQHKDTDAKSSTIPSCSDESQFQGARASWQHKDTDAKSSTTSSRSDEPLFQGVRASSTPSHSVESQFQGARASWQHKDTDAKSSTTHHVQMNHSFKVLVHLGNTKIQMQSLQPSHHIQLNHSFKVLVHLGNTKIQMQSLRPPHHVQMNHCFKVFVHLPPHHIQLNHSFKVLVHLGNTKIQMQSLRPPHHVQMNHCFKVFVHLPPHHIQLNHSFKVLVHLGNTKIQMQSLQPSHHVQMNHSFKVLVHLGNTKITDAKSSTIPSRSDEPQFLGARASWQHADTESTTIPSHSEKTSRSMEITTAGSSRNEPMTIPVNKSQGVSTVCNIQKENAESPAVNVCSNCPLVSILTVNIFGCDHNFCTGCIQLNFRDFTIRGNSKYLSCPKCKRPGLLEDKKFRQAYLEALRIALKRILIPSHYELFKEVLKHKLTSPKCSDQSSGIRKSNLENDGIHPGSSSDDSTEAGIEECEMAAED